MKKSHIALATTATLASILLANVGTTAHAADVDTANGTGKVQFYIPSTPTPPMDPSNPTNPLNPDDSTVPDGSTPTGTPEQPGLPPVDGGGNVKTLRLDSVPNFNFGNHPVTDVTGAATVVYGGNGVDDKTGTETVNNPEIPYFVQVTDFRGSAKGWDVRVTATPFKTATAGNNDTLTGATVSYASASAIGVSSGAGGAVNQNPHDKAPASTITADGATSTDLFGATDGFGTLTSQNLMGSKKEDVKLTIPASVKAVQASEYTSTFTYTLSDAPTTLS